MLSDLRRDAAWQAANGQESQTLIDEMLAIRAGSAAEPSAAIGARRQTEARQKHDTYSRLPQIGMPVLICGGRYDGVAPVTNQETLRRQIPTVRLALFEGESVLYAGPPSV